MAFGICFSLKMTDRQRHILLLAKLLHEGLVAVRLCASQMEVTMQSMKPVAQFLHNEQQSSRVCSATKSYIDKRIGFKSYLLLGINFYLINKGGSKFFTLHSSLFTFLSTVGVHFQ